MSGNQKEDFSSLIKSQRRMWEFFWGRHYEEGMNWGIDFGKEQALRRTLVKIVQLRFPDLTEFGEEHTKLCGSDMLETLIIQMLSAPDETMARQLLKPILKRQV